MESIGTASIPAFLLKLRGLLDDEKTNELICWDESGCSFHLYNQIKFAKEVLPKFFKHNNLASFVRQLNMYGFKKMTSLDQGGLQGSSDEMEFLNPDFIRDAPQRMINIRRKGATLKLKESTALQPAYMREVVSDMKDIKGAQDNITGQLEIIKKENSVLWREIASLRQKHVQQQQVINKLIHFLMSMAGTGRRNRMKRTMPLMIEDTARVKKPRKSFPKRSLPTTLTDMNEQISKDGVSIKDITDEPHRLSSDEPHKLSSDSPISEGLNLNLPQMSDIHDLGIDPVSLAAQPQVESPPQASTSTAVVPASTDNPVTEELSENIGELQTDIDLLKDIFCSGNFGLTDDTLFNGENDHVPPVPANIPINQMIDLDELLTSSLSEAEKEKFMNQLSDSAPDYLMSSSDQGNAIEAAPLTDEEFEHMLASAANSAHTDNKDSEDHTLLPTNELSLNDLD